MITSFGYLVAGTILLYLGADWVVKSGVYIARKFRIQPLIIGLTIVAFGTSLPELVVSLDAAFKDHSPIAIGNVIGSNIANVGLVLGLSAFIFPITIRFNAIKRNIFIYLFVCGVFILFLMDNYIARWEGGLLFIGIILYTWSCIKHPPGPVQTEPEQFKSLTMALLVLLGGIFFLYVGAELFVKGAMAMALLLGVNEVVIGMSVVAFGTSLPELATSLVAAFKKESAISIGNIIGSNLFNILSVIGLVAMIKPLDCPHKIMSLEIPFMVGFGIVLIPLSLLKQPIPRWASSILVLGYILFIWLLFNR